MSQAGGVNVTSALSLRSTIEGSEGRSPVPKDLPASPADPLAALFRNLRPLGAWVEEAACADLDDEAAAVFTADDPDPDALAVAEATCWRCPVRRECADYASGGPSWGLWGADWHNGRARPRRAA